MKIYNNPSGLLNETSSESFFSMFFFYEYIYIYILFIYHNEGERKRKIEAFSSKN